VVVVVIDLKGWGCSDSAIIGAAEKNETKKSQRKIELAFFSSVSQKRGERIV
jgi:hypothetical protein